MSTTITNALPDIPRLYTGICEWLACVVYLLVIYRRVPLRRTIAVGLIGLPAMIAIQYFDGVMPIWFWVIGMLLAFAGMWAIILFGAGTRAGAVVLTAVTGGHVRRLLHGGVANRTRQFCQ